MSNLDKLLEGNVTVADTEEFIPMTEADVSNLLYIAMEDAAMEAGIEALGSEDSSVLEGAEVEDLAILETSIVKLDKKAKKQRAYKLSILQCAKEDNNKDYAKLETLWKMEKFLFRKLEKRYASKARTRMNQTAKKTPAKSNILKKVKATLTRSQKETQKALSGQTKAPTQLNSKFNSISAKLGKQIS